MKPTEKQKEWVHQLKEAYLCIKALHMIKNKEQEELERKVTTYLVSIGKYEDYEYRISQEEREANIGPVIISKERREREKLLHETYDLLITLFEKVVGKKVPDWYNWLTLFREIEKKGMFDK